MLAKNLLAGLVTEVFAKLIVDQGGLATDVRKGLSTEIAKGIDTGVIASKLLLTLKVPTPKEMSLAATDLTKLAALIKLPPVSFSDVDLKMIAQQVAQSFMQQQLGKIVSQSLAQSVPAAILSTPLNNQNHTIVDLMTARVAEAIRSIDVGQQVCQYVGSDGSTLAGSVIEGLKDSIDIAKIGEAIVTSKDWNDEGWTLLEVLGKWLTRSDTVQEYAKAMLTYKDVKGVTIATFITEALLSHVDANSIVTSMMDQTFKMQGYTSPVPFMTAPAHLIATIKITVAGTTGQLTQHVAERMTSTSVLQQLATMLAGATLQDGTTLIASLSRSIIPNLGLSNTTVSKQILQGMPISNATIVQGILQGLNISNETISERILQGLPINNQIIAQRITSDLNISSNEIAERLLQGSPSQPGDQRVSLVEALAGRISVDTEAIATAILTGVVAGDAPVAGLSNDLLTRPLPPLNESLPDQLVRKIVAGVRQGGGSSSGGDGGSGDGGSGRGRGGGGFSGFARGFPFDFGGSSRRPFTGGLGDRGGSGIARRQSTRSTRSATRDTESHFVDVDTFESGRRDAPSGERYSLNIPRNRPENTETDVEVESATPTPGSNPLKHGAGDSPGKGARAVTKKRGGKPPGGLRPDHPNKTSFRTIEVTINSSDDPPSERQESALFDTKTKKTISGLSDSERLEMSAGYLDGTRKHCVLAGESQQVTKRNKNQGEYNSRPAGYEDRNMPCYHSMKYSDQCWDFLDATTVILRYAYAGGDANEKDSSQYWLNKAEEEIPGGYRNNVIIKPVAGVNRILKNDTSYVCLFPCC